MIDHSLDALRAQAAGGSSAYADYKSRAQQTRDQNIQAIDYSLNPPVPDSGVRAGTNAITTNTAAVNPTPNTAGQLGDAYHNYLSEKANTLAESAYESDQKTALAKLPTPAERAAIITGAAEKKQQQEYDANAQAASNHMDAIDQAKAGVTGMSDKWTGYGTALSDIDRQLSALRQITAPVGNSETQQTYFEQVPAKRDALLAQRNQVYQEQQAYQNQLVNQAAQYALMTGGDPKAASQQMLLMLAGPRDPSVDRSLPAAAIPADSLKAWDDYVNGAYAKTDTAAAGQLATANRDTATHLGALQQYIAENFTNMGPLAAQGLYGDPAGADTDWTKHLANQTMIDKYKETGFATNAEETAAAKAKATDDLQGVADKLGLYGPTEVKSLMKTPQIGTMDDLLRTQQHLGGKIDETAQKYINGQGKLQTLPDGSKNPESKPFKEFISELQSIFNADEGLPADERAAAIALATARYKRVLQDTTPDPNALVTE